MGCRLVVPAARRAWIVGILMLTGVPSSALAQPGACPPPVWPQVVCPPTPTFPSGIGLPSTQPTPLEGLTAAPVSPPLLGAGLAAGVGSGTIALSNVGYIDSAIVANQVRSRYDAAFNSNRPSRAEFFYPKPGPGNPGPKLPETSIDYQEMSTYIEELLTPRISTFVEVPFRYFDGGNNANAFGLSDVNAGFRWAMLADADTTMTFQFRTYAPSGEADRGLGTRHVSLEPALLVFQRLTDAVTLEGEFRDWIPVGGTDFSGNVLRYGVGLSYLAFNTPSLRASPVAEIVGWTVLGGKEQVGVTGVPAVPVVQSASGDTIVNAKLGVRVGFGDMSPWTLLSQSDLYVGYGRALTGEVWYKDIVRVELRMRY